MRQKFILLFLLFVASICLAQSPQTTTSIYYDTFGQKWLDPNRWLAKPPDAWGNPLEVVREIRNGQLRLAVRNVGNTDSNSGVQAVQSDLYFPNPAFVNSITADITVVSANGSQCPANTDNVTHSQVMIGGNFFNTGSGDPADDIAGLLMIWVDMPGATTVKAGGWSNQVGWINIGQYDIGQQLTGTIRWDKANHQFIASIKTKDGITRVTVPYTSPDSTPPASPYKNLSADLETLNCLGTRPFGQVEALFDNVIINR